jgi:hypothetical protein
MQGSRDAKIMSFFDLPSRENIGLMSTLDKLFCEWSRKKTKKKKKKMKAKSGCCREQMGRPEVMKHFARRKLDVRLQCTLILYLHGRTSIGDDLRYHVYHLREFIVYIRDLSLTFSHSSQSSSVSSLPFRHSTLKQHSSNILPSLSFKHLYVNKPVTPAW